MAMKGMRVLSNNAQIGWGSQTMLIGITGPSVRQKENSPLYEWDDGSINPCGQCTHTHIEKVIMTVTSVQLWAQMSVILLSFLLTRNYQCLHQRRLPAGKFMLAPSSLHSSPVMSSDTNTRRGECSWANQVYRSEIIVLRHDCDIHLKKSTWRVCDASCYCHSSPQLDFVLIGPY